MGTDREYILFLEARINALVKVVSWMMNRCVPGNQNPSKDILEALDKASEEYGEY